MYPIFVFLSDLIFRSLLPFLGVSSYQVVVGIRTKISTAVVEIGTAHPCKANCVAECERVNDLEECENCIASLNIVTYINYQWF